MKLTVTANARKDFKQLPKDLRISIRHEMNKMIENPTSVNLLKLKGSEDKWRLRYGDYRVMLQIIDNEAFVIAVTHRKDAY